MKFFKSFVCVVLLLVVTPTFAQEAVNQEKPNIEVSGVGYLEWNKELKNSTPGEHQNTFEIKRVYLNFQKKFDEVWSVRVTTDVGQVESEGLDNSSTLVKSKTNPYTMYIKYAYIEAKQKFDVVAAKLRFGMVGTPLIGFVDKQSDYRWIEQNYVDQAKTVLGTSIDTSADMGIEFDLSFMKMLKLTGALINGEGYKKVNESDLGDDGKAYYGMLSVTPIKGVDIFGTYRNEVTDDGDASNNYNRYIAFGGSYSIDVIKLGTMYVMPKKALAGVEREYTLFDSWLLANFQTVVQIPIIISGRYAFGKDKDNSNSKVTVWAAGIGYQVNDAIRVLAYYQNTKAKTFDNPETTLYIKTEVKF